MLWQHYFSKKIYILFLQRVEGKEAKDTNNLSITPAVPPELCFFLFHSFIAKIVACFVKGENIVLTWRNISASRWVMWSCYISCKVIFTYRHKAIALDLYCIYVCIYMYVIYIYIGMFETCLRSCRILILFYILTLKSKSFMLFFSASVWLMCVWNSRCKKTIFSICCVFLWCIQGKSVNWN